MPWRRFPMTSPSKSPFASRCTTVRASIKRVVLLIISVWTGRVVLADGASVAMLCRALVKWPLLRDARSLLRAACDNNSERMLLQAPKRGLHRLSLVCVAANLCQEVVQSLGKDGVLKLLLCEDVAAVSAGSELYLQLMKSRESSGSFRRLFLDSSCFEHCSGRREPGRQRRSKTHLPIPRGTSGVSLLAVPAMTVLSGVFVQGPTTRLLVTPQPRVLNCATRIRSQLRT
jgi:hypothetical protein